MNYLTSNFYSLIFFENSHKLSKIPNWESAYFDHLDNFRYKNPNWESAHFDKTERKLYISCQAQKG